MRLLNELIYLVAGVNGGNQIITAQCARLTAVDTEVCGGMIHTIEKPLKPLIKR